MSNLRNAISQLANQFAEGVLEALRSASLEDVLRETTAVGGTRLAVPAVRQAQVVAKTTAPVARPARKRGRLGRRSAGDIAQVVTQIVALLGQYSKGLRAEQIRSKLGL